MFSYSEGIHVFVLDTGVNVDHLDFEGRAENNANFIETENETDMGGHGKLFVYTKKKNI